MWHIGSLFLPLPPPVSYTKWIERSSENYICSIVGVLLNFLFFTIWYCVCVYIYMENNLGENTERLPALRKSIWAWTSVERGLLKALFLSKTQQLMMWVSPAFEHPPKTHTLLFMSCTSWNTRLFGQQTFCLNATKCLVLYQKVWRGTQQYKEVKSYVTISAASEYLSFSLALKSNWRQCL